mmetsp:Transcript_92701/g.258217  ORF Transcript_92701/g.258217 Transcript_92701/m.258217 type:complete len:110 (+) Transcript_92701:383-712(+)
MPIGMPAPMLMGTPALTPMGMPAPIAMGIAIGMPPFMAPAMTNGIMPIGKPICIMPPACPFPAAGALAGSSGFFACGWGRASVLGRGELCAQRALRTFHNLAIFDKGVE